jgi:hypothetical protein
VKELETGRLVRFWKRTNRLCAFSWSICDKSCHIIRCFESDSSWGYVILHKSLQYFESQFNPAVCKNVEVMFLMLRFKHILISIIGFIRILNSIRIFCSTSLVINIGFYEGWKQIIYCSIVLPCFLWYPIDSEYLITSQCIMLISTLIPSNFIHVNVLITTIVHDNYYGQFYCPHYMHGYVAAQSSFMTV